MSLARPFRRRQVLPLFGAGALALLGACRPALPDPLRLGVHVWPGYEMFHLAREQGRLSPRAVHLVEMPSASASMRALAMSSLEAAGLTLDEVLTARAHGVPLQVAGVLDVSLGADVVLARPGIETVTALAGRRIGVEASATGAVMLDAMLARYGMRTSDLKVERIPFDQHEAAWRAGRVDALVTFEPVRGRLLAGGARLLFSSAEVPGRIVDVLAVREDALPASGPALRQALAGHFWALEAMQQAPRAQVPALAARLGLTPAEAEASYAELDMPGLPDNQAWLRPGGRLQASAERLREVMMAAGLLREAVDLDRLGTADWLPEGVPS